MITICSSIISVTKILFNRNLKLPNDKSKEQKSSFCKVFFAVYNNIFHTFTRISPSVMDFSFNLIQFCLICQMTDDSRQRSFEFFHNSRLIRWIQQKKIYKKFRDLTSDWTQITCLTVRHPNHYTRVFSVFVWGYNWILFMHGWFCPICLIYLIGRKSLHFEKLEYKASACVA